MVNIYALHNVNNEIVSKQKEYSCSDCPAFSPGRGCEDLDFQPIRPLQDQVTWYGINYAGTQMTHWDFQNTGTLSSPARLSYALIVLLRHLSPSAIYSVPCDRILQRAYSPPTGEPTWSVSQVKAPPIPR